MFGQWIKARGVEKEVQVIAKGAHSPYCFPDIISAQLDMSLDRLGLDHAAIYFLHRDNPDVPVSEFIDALNRERDAGRIGMFGGSNWSIERLLEANDYAAQNGLEPFRILNNNLSLAVMEIPLTAAPLIVLLSSLGFSLAAVGFERGLGIESINAWILD